MNLQDCTRLVRELLGSTVACIFVSAIPLESVKSYHVLPFSKRQMTSRLIPFSCLSCQSHELILLYALGSSSTLSSAEGLETSCGQQVWSRIWWECIPIRLHPATYTKTAALTVVRPSLLVAACFGRRNLVRYHCEIRHLFEHDNRTDTVANRSKYSKSV